jgi:16S rRNA C967 or C1407 C5-methylase (RsmB/RsmF family)/NOL1/NOP2/fmu family ribosome biogenesis protein
MRGVPGFDVEAFLAVHSAGAAPTSIRANPSKGGVFDGDVPWCTAGRYVFPRPAFILEPSWHTGRYYVQEASSMFLEQAFSPGLRVLDACAAPGGKSTHLQTLVGDGLLVSNEVIRSRVGVLSENLQRWGGSNVVVTSNDPSDFASLPGFFDLVMVDAPCSGSGLWRRDPEAIAEWSPAQVELCGARQERILGDLWPCLREGGLLIYSTCSYSVRENEAILDWLCAHYPLESVRLPAAWGIVETQSVAGAFGYRFYPYLLQGEGLFMACLRKLDSSGAVAAPRVSWARPPAFVQPWLDLGEYRIFTLGETAHAIPDRLSADFATVASALWIRQAGIPLGQVLREELIPDHALALSGHAGTGFARLELDHAQALAYVRKDELVLEGAPKGWAMVCYEGYGLGWVKVLQGRINNYFPKNLRVLKRSR